MVLVSFQLPLGELALGDIPNCGLEIYLVLQIHLGYQDGGKELFPVYPLMSPLKKMGTFFGCQGNHLLCFDQGQSAIRLIFRR